jgi:hypothetical protein
VLETTTGELLEQERAHDSDAVVSGRSLGVSERRAPRHPKPLVVRGLASGVKDCPVGLGRRAELTHFHPVGLSVGRCRPASMPADEACNLLPLISGRRPIAETNHTIDIHRGHPAK